MDTWMKVSYALILGMMLVFLWPRAKAMMSNSPKAEKGDWRSVAIPLLGVVLFVLFLISMVRN